jgi:hypothetical protein
MAKTIEFGEFAPDLTDLGSATSLDIIGVLPRADGYGPFKNLESFTQALPGPNRGYFFARRADGSIAVFAGTATELYLLNNTDFSWTVVSKATYSPLVSTDNWQFAQFNDLVIAVQVNTPPQKFALSSSTKFADLGGSPPAAGRIAIVGFFVMLTKLLSNPRRVQWSDLDAPESWTAGVGLSDFQDLPDGGSTHAISGGDAFGLVFQDESIRSLTYAPGSAAIFQINRISTQETLFAEYSVINAGDKTFYCGAAGFKMVVAGNAPVAIGKERVDRFFFGDVDRGNLQLVIGASDPTGTRVFWAYKSGQGNAGLFDKILCYDWSIGRAGEWSLILMSGEYLASLAKPGLTLEQLDAIAPGALTVTGAANNGSGLIRLTLNAISNANFSIAGQNFIVVQGVVGTTEANGTWPVNIIDPTHIDLIGSAFVHAYVSGGAIGGSLDALPFSLDSVAKSAVAQLSAFDPNHKLGFFSGANIEATMETPEQDGEGQMIFTTGIRPMTDCAASMCSIGWRNNPNATVAYTGETAIDETGWAPQLIEARYQRGKLRCPAGTSWSYAKGLQPDGQAAGER